jgi:hypothetical protein
MLVLAEGQARPVGDMLLPSAAHVHGGQELWLRLMACFTVRMTHVDLQTEWQRNPEFKSKPIREREPGGGGVGKAC